MDEQQSSPQEIRTDLWGMMTLAQLEEQKSILLNRLTAATMVASGFGGATPSVVTLIHALQHAQTTLQHLIDTRISNGER